MLMSDLRQFWDRRDVVLRVSDRLDVYGLGTLVDSGREGLRLVIEDELDADAVFLEENLELIVRLTTERTSESGK